MHSCGRQTLKHNKDVQIEVSSGDVTLLAEGKGSWTSFNSGGARDHWIDVHVAPGQILSRFAIIVGTPHHVVEVFTSADAASEHVPEELAWESDDFPSSTDAFVTIPLDYRRPIARLRFLTRKRRSMRVHGVEVHTKSPHKRRRCPFSTESLSDALWNDTAFRDCTIRSHDGEEFRAHCCLLATRSPVFHRMLSTVMREGAQRVVAIPAPSTVVRALLKYCYGQDWDGRFDLPDKISLLENAHVYALSHLFEETVNDLILDIASDNVVVIVKALRKFCGQGIGDQKWREISRKVTEDSSLVNAFLLEA